MMSDDTALLTLTGIGKSFNNGEVPLQVLHHIDLKIHTGEMVAIIGASGSGKSTLMNIMACLDTPSSGNYLINGHATKDMDKEQLAALRREYFGFIFQRYQLLNLLTAEENVAMPAIYAGKNKVWRLKRARELLTKLGLSQRHDYLPTQLSGGQQQRVSIARALMNGGQIIFADEPTGALDSKSGLDVMQILTELNQQGHTIIIVTHDPKIAEYASRVIEIKDGNIISDNAQKPIRHPHKTADDIGNPLHQKSFLSGLKEALRMAVLTMIMNKVRTLLTMLGIIIGIASVVLIVALGNGSKQQVLKDINLTGTPTLSITAGANLGEKNSSGGDTLTLVDMHALAAQSYIKEASPDLSSSMTIRRNNIERSASVNGVNVGYEKLQNATFVEGKMFSKADLKNFRQYVLISDKTKTALFGNQSAVGEVIFLDGIPTKVIGVFKQNGVYQDRNLSLWIPYTTFQARFLGASNHLNGITLLLEPNYSSALAATGVTNLLKKRHGKQDFTLFNSDSLAKTIEKTAATLTLLVSAIAVISLLVGGIGVMNIMLVSVTERTSEIGVRMAVGARYTDIIQQFLIEAIVVCFVGGIIGILLAFLAGFLLSLFNVQVLFSTTSILVAVLCSSLIGLVFGFMPAHRAAKMNPIDALNKA